MTNWGLQMGNFMKITWLMGAALLGLQIACSPATNTQIDENKEQISQNESDRLAAFFHKTYEQGLKRSPMAKTYIGRKDEDYGKWDDPSLEHAVKTYTLQIQAYETMRTTYQYDQLDASSQLSWRLAEFNAKRAKRSLPFLDYEYTFNQMFGIHSQIPGFLINQHGIKTKQDANDYIARLKGVDAFLGGHVQNTRRQFENGIHPPAFVYPHIINAAKNIISGAPFSGEKDSPLLNDFKTKISKLSIDSATKASLIEQARAALLSSLGPAYQALIDEMKIQGENAGKDDGVWKLPNGGAYYANLLRNMTTTSLSPTEIHQLGLREVARIHGEMRAIMAEVHFNGTLPEFMHFMRTDPQFYYPDTDEGRAAYLAKAVEIIDEMRTRLDDIFITKPKADISVKAVEPFREATAGKAFYQRPALDGSRPGLYYANLYNMQSMPTYQMEALAYHEGIPGHHMQLSIAQELTDIPMFRKLGSYTAYIEGWGLYSELTPKEMGLYADPYSNFGRLAMELWRAARLVVDTGLHDQRWTREQAIAYLRSNTPNSAADCTNAIERYIVMPGQATAYKIGMLKILELRAYARTELGENFDIRQFHDVILASGALPLTILEELVQTWVKEEKQGK